MSSATLPSRTFRAQTCYIFRSLALGLLAALAVFAKTHTASAHSYHTPNICAATAPEICAHVGFNGQPKADIETEFMLHFMPKAGVNAKLISNVGVKTWMNMSAHSHYGAPVTVTQADDVHFEVKKVDFLSMPGKWEIRVSFDYNGGKHEIAIPIDVL